MFNLEYDSPEKEMVFDNITLLMSIMILTTSLFNPIIVNNTKSTALYYNGRYRIKI